LKKELIYSIDHYGTIKYFLFKGLRDNWLEWIFYLKYRHPFLQPTYFSLAGLINIQRTASCLNKKDLWHKFITVNKEAVWEGGSHYFDNPANFCWDKHGFLKTVDYGSPSVQGVIKKTGIVFHQIHKSSIEK
ncbi:MAG: hypothetical protein Q8N55_04170, partial [bacterium]|nr:hypothetical protein [bacterium]